jgi:hypothetical protein
LSSARTWLRDIGCGSEPPPAGGPTLTCAGKSELLLVAGAAPRTGCTACGWAWPDDGAGGALRVVPVWPTVPQAAISQAPVAATAEAFTLAQRTARV